VTGLEVLLRVLDAGGCVIPGPQRPRLLTPRDLRPLVDAHLDELRTLLAVRGPNGEVEVLRRAHAFRRQLDEWALSGRIGLPTLLLSSAPEACAGQCVSCGDPIASGWRCPLCLGAIYVALNPVSNTALGADQ
jgi:hypothetical protein